MGCKRLSLSNLTPIGIVVESQVRTLVILQVHAYNQAWHRVSHFWNKSGERSERAVRANTVSAWMPKSIMAT